MKIIENNRYSKRELRVALVILCSFGLLLFQNLLLMIFYFLVLFLFGTLNLFTRRVEIKLNKEVITIELKILGLVYKRLVTTFDNVIPNSCSISFKKQDTVILEISRELAIEETEISSINIWFKGRYYHIGNENNALSIFRKIENFYNDAPNEHK